MSLSNNTPSHIEEMDRVLLSIVASVGGMKAQRQVDGVSAMACQSGCLSSCLWGAGRKGTKRAFLSNKSDTRKPCKIKDFQSETDASGTKRTFLSNKFVIYAHAAKQHRTAFAVLLLPLQTA